ncbi:MAG: diadenylate cyclase [Bacteroidota bacterium]
MPNTIRLFMWGYQRDFQISAKVSAESLFGALDPALDPEVVLVGGRLGSESNRHPLCVDPEDGDIPLDQLDGLAEQVEQAQRDDPENEIIHSHPVAEQNCKRRVRWRAFSEGVARTLALHRPDRAFFASFPQPVEHHLVTCVLHLDRGALEAHPRLHQADYLHRFVVPTSLVEATIQTFLDKCTDELSRSEPGMWLSGRGPADLLRNAGRRLMTNPGRRLAWGGQNDDLYDQVDAVSALRYEGAEGKGRLLLTDKDGTGVRRTLTLESPVPLKAGRAARKLVEMATSQLDLLATPVAGIYGLGTADPDDDPSEERVFEVVFLKGNAWELRHAGVPLMRVAGGIPELPRDPIQRADFDTLVKRVLGSPGDLDPDALWTAVEAARRQRHGTLLVVSTGAASEAARLAAQSTPVEPVTLTPALVHAVSAIDGAVLVDAAGTCHAVGAILDGMAADGGDPGRGARYNSAHRYVETAARDLGHRTLAVVVSEDGMVDALPALRPQLDLAEIETRLADLRHHRENPHESRTLFCRTEAWLRKHAFYLDAEQCEEVNEAVRSVRQAWHEAEPTAIRVVDRPLAPHPDFDQSYLTETEEP